MELPLRWSTILLCENSLFTGPWPHTELLPGYSGGATMWRPGGPWHFHSRNARATHTCSKARSFIGGDRSTPHPYDLVQEKELPQNPNFIWGRGRCLNVLVWWHFGSTEICHISSGWILKYLVVKWHVWGLLSYAVEIRDKANSAES